VFWLSAWVTVFNLHLGTIISLLSSGSRPLISVFFTTVMSLGSAVDPEEPPYCNSRTEGGTLGNTFCGAQSFFIVTGGLGAAFWFVVVGLNLLLMLAFDYRFVVYLSSATNLSHNKS